MFSLPILTYLVLAFTILNGVNGSGCVCADTKLCKPLPPPRLASPEFFAFAVDSSTSYPLYDWDTITTLAVAGELNPELVCIAHKTNTRVVKLVDIAKEDLVNQTAIQQSVEQNVGEMVMYGLDGINVDFEDYILKSETEYRDGLTDWVRQLGEAMRQTEGGDGLQLSVDVAWSPAGIDERFFDYKALHEVSDLLFIMVYDTRSQFPAPCVAGANSPSSVVHDGLQAWKEEVGDLSRTVLGLPFYGYTYPCLQGTPTNATICPIEPIHWRNATCSDAAGSEWDYDLLSNFLANATTSARLDHTTYSMTFNYRNENGGISQVWYDTPLTLAQKAKIGWDLEVGGSGMWELDSIDHCDASTRARFYNALKK